MKDNNRYIYLKQGIFTTGIQVTMNISNIECDIGHLIYAKQLPDHAVCLPGKFMLHEYVVNA
jgi:hypothetical protein